MSETIKDIIYLIPERYNVEKMKGSCDICFWEPEKIENEHKTKKIKILLREPWERAFYMWKWMLQQGFEWIDKFDLAVSLERKRYFEKDDPKIKTYIWNYMYFTAGRYSIFIKKIKEMYEKSVEISVSPLQNIPDFDDKIPLNPKVQFALQTLSEVARSISPKSALPFEVMKKINIMLGRKINTHWCKDFLKEAYKKDVEMLSETTKLDFYSIWYGRK